MRTHVFSGAAAALALITASGCCGTQTQYLAQYPDGTRAVITKLTRVTAPAPAPAATKTVVVAAPAPAPVVVVAEKPAPNRFRLLRRGCTPCEAPLPPAPAVVAKPAPETKVLIVDGPKITPEGKKVTVLRRGRKGRVICDAETLNRAVVVAQPVVVEPAVVVAEPAVIVAEPAAVIAEPAPVAAVAVEPEPVVEEPSWTKYLAPEQPAAVAEATPAVLPAEPYVAAAPVYAGQQPIVIQPIIQPVIQTGQEVLSGQVQMQPAAPVAYAPMFAPNPLVCGPGQNCFTLPEDQLRSGPQVLTPTASGFLMPQTETTVASAAPAASATALALPPVASQDKYGALTAAPEPARQVVERPEVSMPAPLSQTTTPPVAGTDEIENALDVMMGNTSPMLK